MNRQWRREWEGGRGGDLTRRRKIWSAPQHGILQSIIAIGPTGGRLAFPTLLHCILIGIARRGRPALEPKRTQPATVAADFLVFQLLASSSSKFLLRFLTFFYKSSINRMQLDSNEPKVRSLWTWTWAPNSNIFFLTIPAIWFVRYKAGTPASLLLFLSVSKSN